MVDKILTLSDPSFHQNNLRSSVDILLNSYPLKYIFNTIKNRIKYHLYKNKNSNETNTNKNKKISQNCSIPFVKNVLNDINRAC